MTYTTILKISVKIGVTGLLPRQGGFVAQLGDSHCVQWYRCMVGWQRFKGGFDLSVRFAAVLVLASSLVACVDAETYDARRALPEEVQRNAYAECSVQLNLTHWLHLHKLKSRDGLLHVLGSDGNGVLVAEAHTLNLCAGRRLDNVIASQN